MISPLPRSGNETILMASWPNEVATAVAAEVAAAKRLALVVAGPPAAPLSPAIWNDRWRSCKLRFIAYRLKE